MTNSNIILTVPYEDTYVGPYTMCPKDVLLKGYTDKVGKTIYYNGIIKKVVSVKVTGDIIIVELE